MDTCLSHKISVVIPIFNHANFIIECLASVLNQNDNNFEIVAIDDGSKDNSFDLAFEYLKLNLGGANWQLSRRENVGINKTLNELIKKSTGEIIFILASDDRLASDALSNIRKIYSCEKDKCKIFYYDVSFISWDSKLLRKSAAKFNHGSISLLTNLRFYLAFRLVMHWDAPFQHQFYSREFFDKFGPYPEDLKYEDLYFALLSISLDKFSFVPIILKEYRLRGDCASPSPGILLSDLSQEIVRKRFVSATRKRYKVLLYCGRLYCRSKI